MESSEILPIPTEGLATDFPQTETHLPPLELDNPSESRTAEAPNKRRRLNKAKAKTMRDDTLSPEVQNGSSANGLPMKITQNGRTNGHTSMNGSSSPQSNGHDTNGDLQSPLKSRSATFFGHNREEVTRLIIQGLVDLGYHESADRLCAESGYNVESPSVAAFRGAILEGRWLEAESLLFGSKPIEDGGGVSITNGHPHCHEGLRFAEDADINEIKFRIREQKYLELLEQRQTTNALKVLRQELTPLHQDRGKLHLLSSLIVCHSADDLRMQAQWNGAHGGSRDDLLTVISRAISPSVMIPEHRLASLFDDFKHNQITNCRYHNSKATRSLFVDHTCERDLFPRHEIASFDGQVGEIWCVAFSHNGKFLAVCGKKPNITIFDAEQGLKRRWTLGDHDGSVAFISWSPDDSKIISCSCDRTAKVWDVGRRLCLLTHTQHETPVSSATWTRDSKFFIAASPDKVAQLSLLDMSGQSTHHWETNFRAQDVAMTPDGSRLIISSVDQAIFVYKFLSRQQERKILLPSKITCLSISKDSKYILASLAAGELHLVSIDSGELVQTYVGQKQGKYAIRSCFGGVDENLIVSGSEGWSLTPLV